MLPYFDPHSASVFHIPRQQAQSPILARSRSSERVYPTWCPFCPFAHINSGHAPSELQCHWLAFASLIIGWLLLGPPSVLFQIPERLFSPPGFAPGISRPLSCECPFILGELSSSTPLGVSSLLRRRHRQLGAGRADFTTRVRKGAFRFNLGE